MNYTYHKITHKYDKEILNLAHSIALKSDMRCKHGCIIISNKGDIISSACNKSLPVCKEFLCGPPENKHKYSFHAEESALRNTDYRKLSGATMYVIRLNSSDSNSINYMNSKPCSKCTYIINACIRKYGLKKIYYSNG